MKDKLVSALIRAVRTFIQTFLGVLLPGLAGATTFEQLTATTALEAAAVAGIIAVLWNLAEELGGASYQRG